MVTGKIGYLDFSGENGFKVRIPYTQKYDIEGNYSILEVDGSVYSASYARIYRLEGTIVVGGSNAVSLAYSSGYKVNTNYNTGVWITIKNSSGVAAGPWESVQIQHDDEGKASVTIAVNLSGYATAYQGNVGDTFSVSGSATVELATIPRASTIGATDANIGAVSMIAVDRKSSEFTHSIKYEFGSLSGYINSAGGVASAEMKISATSISFNVPTTFYAQIPNAKTGICKLKIKTYSGTTQIGSEQTAQFTVTAAESVCKPTVSGTVVDSNETTKAMTGDENVLVRFKSNALCTIAVIAQNSASIVTKKITGVAADSSLTVEGIEAASVEFTAVDSRGYQNSATVEYALIPYVKLTCNPADTMIDPGTGIAVMTVKGNFFNGSFGAKSNYLTLNYRIKDSGGSYGSYSAVTAALSGNTYSADISLADLDYQTEYTVEVVVADALDSVSKTAIVLRSIPIADWGENNFAFNIPVKLNAEEDPSEDADAVTLKYLKNMYLALTGGTMTGLLNAGGGIHMKNTNIQGINALYTNDAATNYTEGINFYRDGTNWDSIWINNGVIYLYPKAPTETLKKMLNPVRTVGTEYVTAEYWKGKTVYTKLVNFGTLPSSGTTKKLAHGLSITELVDIQGILAQSGGLTSKFSYGGAYLSLGIDNANIFVDNKYTGSDLNTATALVLLKYTKS